MQLKKTDRGTGMIDLFTWKTANSLKVNIAVSELNLPCRVHAVDLSKGDQKKPEHLARNPNGKVPVIVDAETGVTLFESGAILLYLAEKAGRLMPTDLIGRWQATQWIFWQMAGLGPIAAQAIHFLEDPARGDYAGARFSKELERLFGVLEQRLAGADYIVGNYSMADVAIWPWVSRFGRFGVNLNDYPATRRWYLSIAERPAVVAGVKLVQADAETSMP